MAPHCAHCNSVDVMTGLHEFHCLNCGRMTHADGTALPPDPQFYAPSFQERKAAGEVQ